MLTSILTTVVGGLILAGLVGLAKSRWLYLVVPKLYFNTPLSQGHVITLTLTNAGIRTEQEVQVTLKTTCSYELLASSKSTVSFSSNKVALPKLSRFESVTILLLVEGKTFEHSDIESIESKETVGKTVERKEQIHTPLQHVLAWPIIILFLGGPFVIGTIIGKENGWSAWDYATVSFDWLNPGKPLQNYTTEVSEVTATNGLSKAIKSGQITSKITEIIRRGDIIVIAVKISNGSEKFVEFDLSAKSSAGDLGPLSFNDKRIGDLFVSPNEQKEMVVKAYLPTNLRTKIIILDYHFKNNTESAWFSQTLNFE